MSVVRFTGASTLVFLLLIGQCAAAGADLPIPGWATVDPSDTRKVKEAITGMQRFLRRNPDAGAALRQQLGDLYLGLGDFETARKEYFGALMLDGSCHYCLLAIGYSYRFQEQYREALPLLRKALELRPSDTVTLQEIGLTYLSLDNPQAAYELLERAAHLDPGQPNTLRLLAIAAAHIGSFDRALELYNQLSRSDRAIAFMLAYQLENDFGPDWKARAQTRIGGSAPRARMLENALNAVVTVTSPQGTGSGFAVCPAGLIVTNFHVVQNGSDIEVATSRGDRFLATVVISSPAKDLALLRVPGALPCLTLAASSTVRLGDDVYAVGSPLGLERSVTKGIVSAFRSLDGVRLLQIDAAINSGNSGGPLLASTGHVVGVNSLAIRKDVGEGLGFAIAAEEIQGLLASR